MGRSRPGPILKVPSQHLPGVTEGNQVRVFLITIRFLIDLNEKKTRLQCGNTENVKFWERPPHKTSRVN